MRFYTIKIKICKRQDTIAVIFKKIKFRNKFYLHFTSLSRHAFKKKFSFQRKFSFQLKRPAIRCKTQTCSLILDKYIVINIKQYAEKPFKTEWLINTFGSGVLLIAYMSFRGVLF